MSRLFNEAVMLFVTCDGARRPVRFSWAGREHYIQEIVDRHRLLTGDWFLQRVYD